jgi:hypothetical protein
MNRTTSSWPDRKAWLAQVAASALRLVRAVNVSTFGSGPGADPNPADRGVGLVPGAGLHVRQEAAAIARDMIAMTKAVRPVRYDDGRGDPHLAGHLIIAARYPEVAPTLPGLAQHGLSPTLAAYPIDVAVPVLLAGPITDSLLDPEFVSSMSGCVCEERLPAYLVQGAPAAVLASGNGHSSPSGPTDDGLGGYMLRQWRDTWLVLVDAIDAGVLAALGEALYLGLDFDILNDLYLSRRAHPSGTTS